METQPAWRFRPVDPSLPKWDPVEAEFFTAEGAPDALVREAIQNSLDAATDSTVRVRFAFAKADAAQVQPYVSGLRVHLEASDLLEANSPFGEQEIPLLIVEDFGTSGLNGDELVVRDADAEDASGKNRFYYFWRNIGRSHKQEGDIGRWGVGKRVFPSSSRVFAFFGITRREGEERELLMGQTVLKTHTIGEAEYHPYGYFAAVTDRGVPIPLEESGWTENFKSTFNVSREVQTGLSVAIPWPKEGIDASALTTAAIRHYFFPILEGRLEVVIESLGEVTELTNETVEEVARESGLDWSEHGTNTVRMQRLLRFCRDIQAEKHSPVEQLEVAGVGGRPEWTPELLAEESKERLLAALDNAQAVAVNVPVMVYREGEEGVESGLRVYLQRVPDGKFSEVHYLRRGITIPKVTNRSRRDFDALVVVDRGPLSTLLGDSENIAHTDWVPGADRVKKRYTRGYTTVGFVKRTVGEIIRLITRVPIERDEDWLRDVFAAPHGSAGNSGGGSGGSGPTPPTPPPPSPKLFKVRAVKGGTVISSGADEDRPGRILVELAYDTRGNPMKKWSSLDFDLRDNINIESSSLTIHRLSGNRIEFEPEDSGYELRITGFDEQRDLRVRVEEAEVE